MSATSLDIKERGTELEVCTVLSDVQCGVNYERNWMHECVCVLMS